MALDAGPTEATSPPATGRRRLTTLFISILAVTWSLFQIYVSYVSLPTQKVRAVHLAFAMVLAFLIYNARGEQKERPRVLDLLLVLGALAAGGYVVLYADEFVWRLGNPTTSDLVFGAIAMLVLLEATRRALGLALPIVVVLFLGYAYLGRYLPGFLNHTGYSTERVVNQLYLTTEGIFGLPLGVSASFIFLFMLFGAFLEKSGTGKFFIDLACSVAGGARGGPAKVAVIGSGFFGTISGSAIANVVGTGSFTIPMMKSIGYRPHFAGAVEATASTAGQIMPPVMGAGAFVMAEWLGISYAEVAIAAALPSALYYLAAFLQVDLEAGRTGLKGLPRDQLPPLWPVLRDGLHLVLPLAVMIYTLFTGYTPARAALAGLVTIVLASALRSRTRMGWRDLLSGLDLGARAAVAVALACASAGMIVGVVTMTGLGLRFAGLMMSLSQGNLLAALFMAMLASLVLGTSLPTTAGYIVLIILAGPAMKNLGVEPLAAHMFVFYFAVLSDITPPVALAAYAAAGIAKAGFMSVGFTAVRLAAVGFIVPYLFVYFPVLLLKGDPLLIVEAAVTASLACVALAVGLQGYLFTHVSWPWRIAFLVAASMLGYPEQLTDAAGLLLLLVLVLINRVGAKRLASRVGVPA